MQVIEDYDDFEDFLFEKETVVPEHPTNQSRWSTAYEQVVKDQQGDFWMLRWEVGSTEYQEVDFKVEVTQVYPKEVIKTIYTPSKD